MEIFEAINGRRSIRKFTSDGIRREDLLKMLDAARMAPSGGNLQAWRFIVIEKKALIDEIADIIKEKIAEMAEAGKKLPDSSTLSRHLQARFERGSLFFQNAPITIAVQIGENPNLKPVIDYLGKNGVGLHEAHRLLGEVEMQSGAAAIENLILAAYSLGYGACWMNIPFIAVKEVERILGVEDPWRLIALVPIGVPDPAGIPQTPRKKELEDMVTFIK